MEYSSKKIKAFTLAEIMVVFMIIAVIATATIGIQKSRKNYVTKFSYYATFTNIKTMVAELIADGCDISKDTGCGSTAKLLPTNGHETSGPAINLGFCDRLIEMINVIGNPNCSLTGTITPNFVTTNGVRWFNFGSSPTYLDLASNPSYVVGTGTEYDKEVYTVYADINGTKGNSTINTDLMKFYITRDGNTVIPAEDSIGGIDQNYLSASVRYQLGTKYVWPLQHVTFKEAACSGGTGKIIPAIFNTKFNYCTSGVTIDAPTSATCATEKCEVYEIKPGF